MFCAGVLINWKNAPSQRPPGPGRGDKSGRPIVIGAEVVKVLGPVKRGDTLWRRVCRAMPWSQRSGVGSVIAQALGGFRRRAGDHQGDDPEVVRNHMQKKHRHLFGILRNLIVILCLSTIAVTGPQEQAAAQENEKVTMAPGTVDVDTAVANAVQQALSTATEMRSIAISLPSPGYRTWAVGCSSLLRASRA